MEAIITAATVLTMYFNAINSNDVNYMYNGDMEDGKVNSSPPCKRSCVCQNPGSSSGGRGDLETG